MTTRLKGNMADIANMVEELSRLTVIETAELVKQLETKWGVSAAAPVAVAAAGAPPAGGRAGAPAAGAENAVYLILGFVPARKKQRWIKNGLQLRTGLSPAET